jgi:hypothetical protein
MPKTSTTTEFVLSGAVLHAFEINDGAHLDMMEDLPPDVRCAEPPDVRERELGAIVGHMDNVGMMWLRATAQGRKIPGPFDRRKETPAQAKKGSEPCRAAASGVRQETLENTGGVRGFKSRLAAFFGCQVAHDAHQRGRIAMLARQVCHALPRTPTLGAWEWGTR